MVKGDASLQVNKALADSTHLIHKAHSLSIDTFPLTPLLIKYLAMANESLMSLAMSQCYAYWWRVFSNLLEDREMIF